MNWPAYRRLVDYLHDLQRTEPQSFDYSNPNGGDHGCLACHIRSLDDTNDLPLRMACRQDISDYLGLGDDDGDGGESMYLFGFRGQWTDPSPRAAFGPDGRGEMGIDEALRRLAVVAARHGGEPEQPTPAAFVPNDAAFLASVRALVHAPLVEID